MFDVKQVGDALIASVKAHAAFAVAGVTTRVDELATKLDQQSQQLSTVPTVAQMGDQVVSAVKSYIASQVTPLESTQRELLSRIDKQSQQLSALQKQLAALERKDR